MKLRIIKLGQLPTLDSLRDLSVATFKDTRFKINYPTYGVLKQTPRSVYMGWVNLGRVRLRETKLYCGNHPCACELGNKEDKKYNYMEGADWVEFNDRLNDVLDANHVNADVGDIVRIRRGTERCIEYIEDGANKRFGANYEWFKFGRYADYCGTTAPRGLFPEGTPGRHEQINYALVG